MKVLLSQSTFKPTHAHLAFINDGAEKVALAKPRIGFNRGGEVDGHYFDFDCDPMFKGNPWWAGGKTDYAPEELLIIEPGRSQAITTVALEDYYALPDGGSFKVRYADGENISAWTEFHL